MNPEQAVPPLHAQRSTPLTRMHASPAWQVVPAQRQTRRSASQVPPAVPMRHWLSAVQPHTLAKLMSHCRPAPCAVHELPHPPQFVLLSTCSSQPSSAVGAAGFEQLPYSMRQVEVHRPPEHARDITLVVEQARPHAPQFATLVFVSTSQPLLATPSQSANPVLQVKPQTELVHLTVALARAGHLVVHEPQWFGSVVVLVHCPLQSTWPVGHESTQEPPEQTCVVVHARPQEPQFCGFVAVSTH